MSKKYTVFDAINLKEAYLKTKLKMLGFKDENDLDKPLDPAKGYHVLGRIGSELEKFENPARPCLEGRDDSDDIINAFAQNIAKENTFMENQDEFIAIMRAIYPDFGLNMDKKVSKEDWDFYTKTMQKTGKLIRDLSMGFSDSNETKLSNLEEHDRISNLIDSHDFAKACKIEDTFMIQEFETVKKAIQAKGYDDERVKDSTPCIILAELVRQADSLANKKRRYVSNYDEYLAILKKLKGKEGEPSKLIIQHKTAFGDKEGMDDRDEK